MIGDCHKLLCTKNARQRAMVCVWETLDNIVDAVDLVTGKAGYFFNLIICSSPLRLLGSKTKKWEICELFPYHRQLHKSHSKTHIFVQ
jgi:hypothetical protein